MHAHTRAFCIAVKIGLARRKVATVAISVAYDVPARAQREVTTTTDDDAALSNYSAADVFAFVVHTIAAAAAASCWHRARKVADRSPSRMRDCSSVSATKRARVAILRTTAPLGRRRRRVGKRDDHSGVGGEKIL